VPQHGLPPVYAREFCQISFVHRWSIAIAANVLSVVVAVTSRSGAGLVGLPPGVSEEAPEFFGLGADEGGRRIIRRRARLSDCADFFAIAMEGLPCAE
jgi:hypothetical protein